MRIGKRCLLAAMAFCLLAFGIVPVKAADVGGQPGQVQDGGQQQGENSAQQGGQENMQLVDLAGLLSGQEAEEIDSLLDSLESSMGWDLMALTTNDAGGEDATTYAEAWFDRYTMKDDGVICAIDMDNREIVVRAFGEAMYYITDRRRDRILDAGYEEISNEAYFATLEAMLKEVENAYLQEDPDKNHLYNEDTGEITRHPVARKITLSEILIAAGLALLALAGTVGGIFGRYRLKFGGYQYPIEKNGKVNLTVKEDRFVNSFVTRRHIPKPQDSGGGGGGRSSVHSGSGGRMSSGGSRKF